MLTKEQNKRFTEVGPGTKMGDLLRRYWMPFATVKQLEDHPTRAVTLLGEHLVALGSAQHPNKSLAAATHIQSFGEISQRVIAKDPAHQQGAASRDVGARRKAPAERGDLDQRRPL